MAINVYTERIEALKKLLGSGKVLLIGNGYIGRNYRDNTYPFRQDSSFLYFTGIRRPGLYLVIDIDKDKTTLYGNEASTDDIVWTGPKKSLVALAEAAGIDEVLPKDKLQHLNPEILYLPPYRAEHTMTLQQLTRSKEILPSQKLIHAIIQLRSYKSEDEIAEMETAVNISNKIHETLIRTARANTYEYELVAEATKVALAAGTSWAYSPILTKNGQTLHNHGHYNQMKEGDLILVDAGVERSSSYCADLTRTFPISRRFTPLQKDIYNIVHSSYSVAIYHTKPTTTFKEVHLKAAEAIATGLTDLGWMKGNPKEAVAAGAHSLFFPHGLGHMIGMDVHDMENLGEIHVGYAKPEDKSKEFGLKSLRLGKTLETGFCLTIEPGIYVIPELIDKFQAEGLHKSFINYEVVNRHRDFGGIRLEDDFLVTDDGCRRLGNSELPTTADKIEALRRS